MVRVNDQGEYVRRPARWDDLPSKSHPLLERLAKARLLIVSQQGDQTVGGGRSRSSTSQMAAPEGLAWTRRREFLTGKQQMEVDLRDWELRKRGGQARTRY